MVKLINSNFLYNKSSFLGAIVQRYSSSLFVYLSAFIVGMYVSKVLGPGLLGYWGIFHIITGYYSYSNLGATNGLTRELGLAIGRKDEDAIGRVIGSAHALQITIPGIATLGLIISGFFLSAPLNWVFIVAGLAGFIQMYEETLARILNSFEKHKFLANINIIRALLSFIVVIPLVYYGGLSGRLIAALLISLFMFFFTMRKLPVKLNLSFDKQAAIELIKIGLPIALAGFLSANFYLVDRLVITGYLTMEALGYYVFAYYLVTVIKGVKQTIAGILYQRQNIVYGEDGEEKKKRLLIISKSAALFTTDLTGILSGIGLIIFSFVVRHFLPEYEAAIPVAFVIVFSHVMGNINVMNTIGKHNQYVTILFFALIVNVAMSLFMVHLFGLIGVAWASFISFVLLNIVINYYNLRYFNLSFQKSLSIITRIITVSIYCLLISGIIERIWISKPGSHILNDLPNLILSSLVYLIAMLPLFWFLKSHLNTLNKIKLLN